MISTVTSTAQVRRLVCTTMFGVLNMFSLIKHHRPGVFHLMITFAPA